MADHLSLLSSAADHFDSGASAAYLHLAGTLRVLLYDKADQPSLCTQLSRKTEFLDTAYPDHPANLLAHCGLTVLLQKDGSAAYAAPLSKGPNPGRMRKFEHWWNTPVIRDNAGREMSRANLVLTAANQEAMHVDPGLDATYAALKHDNSLGWIHVKDGEEKPLSDAERVAVRQVAHEVLATLIADYTKEPNFDGASVVAESIFSTLTPEELGISPEEVAASKSSQVRLQVTAGPGVQSPIRVALAADGEIELIAPMGAQAYCLSFHSEIAEQLGCHLLQAAAASSSGPEEVRPLGQVPMAISAYRFGITPDRHLEIHFRTPGDGVIKVALPFELSSQFIAGIVALP
ncbi:hypothetical protein [Phenylobacterium sp.]|uniref:hypothetical protein n=1 Tax=Phenylobacterium sp. TaxID=1871053 RepID=UPI0030F38F34